MIRELHMDKINEVQAAPAAQSNGALVRAVDKASAGAHVRVNAVSDAAHPAVDRLTAGAHRSVDGIAAVASQAAEAIGTRGAQMKVAHERVSAQCRAYVRENPWTSLALAMAAGFAVSRLVSSRSNT
jgi:ElaB/YqjD/DUF883 family membrane-anchored ribosome-binding protein